MAARTDRIEARLAPETADTIKQAAAISGTSTSAFMVDAATDRAQRILRTWRETVLPAELFDQLLESLDEPGEPVPALERAFARLRELVESDSPTAQHSTHR